MRPLETRHLEIRVDLLHTLDEILAADPAPAVALPRIVERVREHGSPCSPELLLRELGPGRGSLRTIEAAPPALGTVAEACPAHLRPTGLDALVVEGGEAGLLPTPRDALRVLARTLDPRDTTARARWARLLEGAAALPR